MEKEYQECYIAFLDMLGFKNLIKEKNFKFLIDVFEKIRYSYKIESKEFDESNPEKQEKNELYKINTKIISDSICLYIEADNVEKLLLLIFACSIIQWELLNFETPIFLRGGTVKGKIYSDGDIIFGEGLTRAYLLEEGNAKYPRIIMTGDILHSLCLSESGLGETAVSAMVFRDFDGFYTVDYFSRLINYKKELGVQDKVVNYVNDILNTTTDSSIREKYNYFINTFRLKVNE